MQESRSKSALVSSLDFSEFSYKGAVCFCLGFSSFLGNLTPSKYTYEDYMSQLASIDKSDIPELYEEVVHEFNSAVKDCTNPAIVHSDDSFRSQPPNIIGLFGLVVDVEGGESFVWENEVLIERLGDKTLAILCQDFPFVQNSLKGEEIMQIPIIFDGNRMRYRPDRLKLDLLTSKQSRALNKLARIIKETVPFKLSSIQSGDVRFMANQQALHSRAPYDGYRKLTKTRIFNVEGF